MLHVCFHTFHSAQHTVIAGFVVSSRSIDLHGQICVKEIALQETLKLLLASDRWKLA
jgi:predicted hotdog family 3-hydroxylacyl-ACP dehydratase